MSKTYPERATNIVDLMRALDRHAQANPEKTFGQLIERALQNPNRFLYSISNENLISAIEEQSTD